MLFTSGHSACAGCGVALASRLVLEAVGKNVIVANATGCLEVFSTGYPYSSWGVPWIHSLFENAPAVASGIELALRRQGKNGEILVLAQGGDGATADIGFGALSGMVERGHNILYVCYDNEAYMNTGVQRSSQTPFGGRTTTTPPGPDSTGNPTLKKNLPEIMVAHNVPYVATTSVAFPLDLQKKVRKAVQVKGPRYLHIHTPCPLGWRFDPAHTIRVGRLAVSTGLFPIIEYVHGVLTSVRVIGKRHPVEDYLRAQGRFQHLFDTEAGQAVIRKLQEIADSNIQRYHLVPESSRTTQEV
ncbi:MAG: thiamine pyrophosphate-dependent enzyme [bacterium JZ-2024 1]